MTAPVDVDRIEVLGRRARWLERYRRLIAVSCALALSPLMMYRLTSFLGSDWPGVHAGALTAIGTVIAWWMVEVSLAWVTAVWETEHYRLLGERVLPRATLLRK
jgi:hypothetical protein